MDNLERLKEWNPKLYHLIKVKYITNVDDMKNRIDKFPLEEYEEKIKKMETYKDFKELQKVIEVKKSMEKLENAFDELRSIRAEIEKRKENVTQLLKKLSKKL